MRECEEWKSKSWSDGDGNSGLCGFEGAKPGAASESPREEVGRPFDGRTDVWRKAEASAKGWQVRRQFECRLTESKSAAAKGSKPRLVSGDNSLRDPPVPIPNTEVKPQHADSTWLETAR